MFGTQTWNRAALSRRASKFDVTTGDPAADRLLHAFVMYLNKMEWATEIRRHIDKRRLTRSKAAKMMKLSVEQLGGILDGKLNGYSNDELRELCSRINDD